MKISGISEIYKTYEAKPAVSGKKVKSGGKKDNLNVSNQAREFQLAFKAVSSAPSVREDKVDDIKARIDSGSYSISAEAVADKILSNI